MSRVRLAVKQKAVEKGVMDTIGAGGSVVTGYISSFWGSASEPQRIKKEKVQNITFSTYNNDKGEVRDCFILCYESGVQVWDICDLDNMFEVVAIRTDGVSDEDSIVRFAQFQKPKPEENICLDPTLFFIYGNKSSMSYKRFHVFSQKEIPKSLKSTVCDIKCNRQVVVIAVEKKKGGKKIQPFSSGALRQHKGTLKFPDVHPGEPMICPIALGSRWVAYPSRQPVADGAGIPKSEGPTTFDVAVSLSSSVYGSIASAVGAEVPKVEEKPESWKETAGIVRVKDIVTGKTIAHFRAQNNVISALAFDPSGSLLITADVDGYECNVFQLCPGTEHQIVHLYKLVRGYATAATITGIAVSKNSKWVSISSHRGTCHIFAINREGGRATVYSHIPSHPIPVHEMPYVKISSNPKFQEYYALAKVRLAVPTQEDLPEMGMIPLTKSHFVDDPFGLLAVSHSGDMNFFKLEPKAPPKDDTGDRRRLMLDATLQWSFDCHQQQDQWPAKLTKKQKQSKAKQLEERKEKKKSTKRKKPVSLSRQLWLSNVEKITHDIDYRLLCAGPQFKFFRYCGSSSDYNSLKPSPITKEMEISADRMTDPEGRKEYIDESIGSTSIRFSHGPSASTSLHQEIMMAKSTPMVPEGEATAIKNELQAMMSDSDDSDDISSLSDSDDATNEKNFQYDMSD
eukprot:TRINITY_DN2489_c0_g1_i4.p1 TRINITY_DN2489_c0_g1~~TRINITY_DN2489_c0_g1_i4.p1  ORF type:complete len:682 (-),score=115.11 TRINITY_DN2489_c0_g1_i4:4-2049(-)